MAGINPEQNFQQAGVGAKTRSANIMLINFETIGYITLV